MSEPDRPGPGPELDPDGAGQARLDALIPLVSDLVDAVVEGPPGAVDQAAAALQTRVFQDGDPGAAGQVVGEIALAAVDELWPGEDDGPAAISALVTYLEAVEAVFQRVGAGVAAAQALMLHGVVDLNTGNLESAVDRLEAAHDRLAGHGGIVGGTPAHNLAEAYLATGRPVQARARFAEAAQRSGQAGLRDAQAGTLARLAEIEAQNGEHAAAGRRYLEVAAVFRDAGQWQDPQVSSEREDSARGWSAQAGNELIIAGTEALNRNRSAEAEELWRLARAAFVDSGDAAPAADAARCLGIVASGVGDDVAAQAWFSTAEAEHRALGNRAGLGTVYLAWGNHAVTRGDVRTAEPMLRSAHAELTAAGNAVAAGATLHLLAALAHFRNAPEEGARLSELASSSMDDPEVALGPMIHAAIAALNAGDPATAARDLDQIRARYLALGMPLKAMAAVLLEMRPALMTGNQVRAEQLVAAAEDLYRRGAADPAARFMMPVVPAVIEMMYTELAAHRRDDVAVARHLTAAREILLRAGSAMTAARIAVRLGELALDAGRGRDATRLAVPALLALASLGQRLPSSAERQNWAEDIARAARTAFRAAAGVGDTVLVAELLEVVRSQAIPEAVDPSVSSTRSAARLIVEVGTALALGRPEDAGRPEQATTLRAPAGVRMPWGAVALQRYLPAARKYVPDLAFLEVVKLPVLR